LAGLSAKKEKIIKKMAEIPPQKKPARDFFDSKKVDENKKICAKMSLKKYFSKLEIKNSIIFF